MAPRPTRPGCAELVRATRTRCAAESSAGTPGSRRRYALELAGSSSSCARGIAVETFSSEPRTPEGISVLAHAAALYVALIKGGHFDEAAEFAEWFLDTFDHDLES